MKKYLLYVSQLYSFSIVRPLQDAIIKNGDYAAWFLAKPEYNHYLKKTEKVLHTVSDVINYNPCAVFVASNTVPDFFPGIKVQLFHGFNAEKRDSHIGHFKVRQFFDLYCTQGPSTTILFQELERKHQFFKVIETGWPKMDPLFSDCNKNKKTGKPTVLFTSTFTPALSAAHKIYKTLALLIEQNIWKWIITLHPKMDAEIIYQYKKLRGTNCIFVETDNIIPLLKKADVMLSDTTSVISEFLLLKKPVVTFRNRKPDYHLINVQEQNNIKASIEKALTRPKFLMDSIEEYIKLIHPYNDGKSSERVLTAANFFINNHFGKLQKKPLNLVRRLKIRLKYHYLKW